MRSTADRSRRISRAAWIACSLALAGCAAAPLEIRVAVDCPVLGKEIRMADDAKEWVLRHQEDAPASVLDFTNAVGTHNEKVREVCRAAAKP